MCRDLSTGLSTRFACAAELVMFWDLSYSMLMFGIVFDKYCGEITRSNE